MSKINCHSHDVFILGDTNVNINRDDRSNSAIDYLSMMTSNGLFPLVTKPTRVTDKSSTLIDHIFTSCISSPLYSGIIQNDLSDHYPIYCIIPNTSLCVVKNKTNLLIRDVKTLT